MKGTSAMAYLFYLHEANIENDSHCWSNYFFKYEGNSHGLSMIMNTLFYGDNSIPIVGKTRKFKIRTCENSQCDCSAHPSKGAGDLSTLSLEGRPLDEYWFCANRWLPSREGSNNQNFCELLPTDSDGSPLSSLTRELKLLKFSPTKFKSTFAKLK